MAEAEGRREKDLDLVEEFESVRAVTSDGRSVRIPKSKIGGNIEVATENVLGGIKASPKSDTDTKEVKIDHATGRLYVPEGEGTPPDNEDITVAEIEGVGKLQFKDKAYNASSYSGLGRTYLRKNMVNSKNVLTQAMFTNDDGSVRSNTRYIIQYDYDLNGATINLPDNCVLDFQGGSLSNGSMKGTGIRTVNKNRGTATFVNGVNINYDNEWVKASEIGMIANDESSASVNDGILDVVVSSGKYLELDGTYYFSKSHNISGILKIRNGELIYTKSDFLIPQENAVLSFDNVNITGKDYFIRKTSLNYVINSVIFDNCTIESIRVCYFSGADILYENNPYGLERFRVSNCKFYNMDRTAMVLLDVVISKECSFTGNYVDSFQYTLLHFGKTNEYSNITDNEIYGCDVVFKGNVIKGDVCNNDSYYTPLLLDGIRRAFIEGNTISNVIGVGITGYPTYECYGTANYYSCKDNVFINICQLPQNGTLASTMPEIFKCKGGGGHKEAINNVWKIDFDECREIVASKGITFTDEVFETLNVIALLRLTSLTDSVYFAKNTITIKGGKLLGNTSSIDIKNIVIDGNTFNLDSYVNNSGMFPNWNGNAEFITITNNRVVVNDDSDFTFCGFPMQRSYKNNATTVVSNNIVNRPVSIPSLNKKMTVKNNIQEFVSSMSKIFNITGADETSVIESYLNYNADRSIVVSSSPREFKNVDYNYVVHNKSSVNYLGIAVNDNVSADLIFDCVDKVEIRVLNTDGEISVTDRNRNVLFSVADPTSSTSYTTFFENSKLKISVKYSPSTQVYIYIIHKVDALTYKLNIASTDMNKISYPTLNRYTKGAYKFDTTANKPVWWNGSAWVDATGVTV